MNLFDFKKFLPFTKLKVQMGIPANYTADFDIDITIATTFIDVILNPDDFSEEDGPFTIIDEYGRRQKVVAYIRDYAPYRQADRPDPKNWNSTYKYHLTRCSVLKRKQNDGTYEKYTGTNRSDGFFKVNLIWQNELISSKDQDLCVCKRCLESLDYQGYRKNPASRSEIYENFSLADFLKNNDTDFVIDPKFSEDEAPNNTYHQSFPDLSKELKKRKNYICENCGLNCSNDHKLLNVHHLNGVKSDNSPFNLRVLCIGCHAEKHPHLKSTDHWKYWLKNKPPFR